MISDKWIGRTRMGTVAAFALLSLQLSGAESDVISILKDAERARGSAKEGLSWDMDMQSVENGVTSQIGYHVKAKGSDAYIDVVAPEKRKGDVYLFKNNQLLYHKPGLKKPVATSSKQKLTGSVSNGDLASINYSSDYDSKIIDEETLDGNDCYVLDLKAKNKTVTYDRIKLWVTKKDHLAIKSEYLNLAGKLAKTVLAEYKNRIKLRGVAEPFVSSLVITIAGQGENKTVVTYQNPKQAKLKESDFMLGK